LGITHKQLLLSIALAICLSLAVGLAAGARADTPTPEPSYEELLAEEFGALNYSLEKLDVKFPAIFNANDVYVLVDHKRHIVCYITREGIACMNDIEYGR
jgi:hypothetical protein